MPQYASITPKPIFYKTNGTGRDTYIETNNGGLTQDKYLAKFPSIGTFGQNNHLRIAERKPNLGHRISLYRADGTGRDSYCFSSKGGFANVDLHDTDGNIYFQTSQSNLSPSKVQPLQELQSDRTLNFFVGQLRSYQQPTTDIYTKHHQMRQKKEQIKRILIKNTLLARSHSVKDIGDEQQRSAFTRAALDSAPLKISLEQNRMRATGFQLSQQNSPIFQRGLQKPHAAIQENMSMPSLFYRTDQMNKFIRDEYSPSRQYLAQQLAAQKQRIKMRVLSQPKFLKGERRVSSEIRTKENMNSNLTLGAEYLNVSQRSNQNINASGTDAANNGLYMKVKSIKNLKE
ncbi:UNKNOWN [Stylonychia lemnae]|uniref:Uncharacterized protein n=1 Tax=Stylonychia lemnae TaxID=5949 RepID=A0A077ZYT8_STYLE|nr:UNKNOWN [Stylonychia lemnae]|eukprot:CDW73703.1 UNKNOWN [Stylonychia lemnae]